MRKKFIISTAAFLMTSGMWSLSAQENDYIKHRVNRGETISKIARDYGVSVSEIFELNPDSKNGVKENDFILIPGLDPSTPKDIVKKEIKEVETHVVEPKETVYSITRKYKISVPNLYKWNPGLKANGLKIGETINVSEDYSLTELQNKMEQAKREQRQNRNPRAQQNEQKDNTATETFVMRTIEPRETLYGIASEHNTTVKRLVELNPEVNEIGLVIGNQIKVPSVFKKSIGTQESEQIQNALNPKVEEIIVESKETIYSITKQYGVSAQELLKMNPDLRFGLKTGMILKVPGKGGIVKETLGSQSSGNTTTESTTSYTNLESQLVKSESKQLALFMPFNINSLGQDVDKKLKSDPFLNMTLDFYSGALLAIERAQTLGLPLTVQVYDANESKTSSDVASLILKEDFKNTDVVIGPFFQSNINTLSSSLKNSNTVIVSPLSTEKSFEGSNKVIQTMPSTDLLQRALLDYLIAQNANIVVITDDKKNSTRNFVQKVYPSVRILNSSAAKTIGDYLKPQVKNVVVLDSNSIEAALTTTNTLISKSESLDVQLAAFEKNAVFDYSEITIEKLVALKLIYPSITRENETEKATNFAKLYKEKNNIYPNRFATRGYDVTLDIILRMFNKEGLAGSMEEKSQQIENKFIYNTNALGVQQNTGIYLMQFDEDLTIKVIQ